MQPRHRIAIAAGIALLSCGVSCDGPAPDEPAAAPPAAEQARPAPLHGATEDPTGLPPRGPDFPTHHRADHISQAIVDHTSGKDPAVLEAAAAWAEQLATTDAPAYRFGHQLHAYTQRLLHGPEAETRVLAGLPDQEPAAYRYWFDRPPDQVSALLSCNLVASCTWREDRAGFRKPGGEPFELVELGDAPVTDEPEPIRCGGWEIDPSSCPDDFPVFERSSWLEMGRDRLALWSTQHTPLTMELLLREIGLEPGMHAADIGSGAGWFSLPFAHAVGPEGRLYAVDIDPVFTDYLEAVAADAGLAQLQPVLSEGVAAELPAGSLDLVWVALVYQDLYLMDLQAGTEPATGATMAFSRGLIEALKPGGRLAVVEIGPRSNGTGAAVDTGYSLEALWAHIEQAGFEPERTVPTVIHAQLRTFTRPIDPPTP